MLLLVAVGAVAGIARGLIGLGTRTPLHHQVDPAAMVSAAGLLRTFTCLGAMAASAVNAAFLPRGATGDGLHHLTLFMLGGAALLFLLALPGRSPDRMSGQAVKSR
ncbi:hypothetical protein AB0D10_37160 [Kitasatospora sp. NPDC048545]|uniref:hypothetical protein n=1 Tax=Kitasatospora sp. NPDC048545 TaxID=3157208 RepID=UPI0033DA7556